MKKIKIGFVGLGDHALQSHLALLLKDSRVEVVDAFDPNPNSFVRVKEEYGVDLNSFSSYEALLEKVDAVFICSPDKFHFEQLSSAISLGKHVFCEKPLSTNEKEFLLLEKILTEAEEKGLVVTTCHPRRFDFPYVYAKNELKDYVAEYGDLISVKLDFTYHKPSADKIELHGGSMLQDHINHEIDYINFLAGHSKFVAHKLIDVADRYEVSGIREDNISFFIGGTRRLETRGIFSETIELRFERATVHIETKSEESFIYDHEKNLCHHIEVEKTNYDYRFREINNNFIGTILGEKKNYLTKRDMIVNSYVSSSFDESFIQVSF